MDTLSAIGVAGTFLSLAGVIITLCQIKKVRNAAEAAKTAATTTHAAITRNVALADLSSTARSLDELKILIRGQHFDAALLRISDLTSQVTQLQHLGSNAHGTVDFKHILTEFAILRDLLERRIHVVETRVNPAHVNRMLSQITDQLNDWIGSRKYALEQEET